MINSSDDQIAHILQKRDAGKKLTSAENGKLGAWTKRQKRSSQNGFSFRVPITFTVIVEVTTQNMK